MPKIRQKEGTGALWVRYEVKPWILSTEYAKTSVHQQEQQSLFTSVT